jgi:hypothetical protein
MRPIRPVRALGYAARMRGLTIGVLTVGLVGCAPKAFSPPSRTLPLEARRRSNRATVGGARLLGH